MPSATSTSIRQTCLVSLASLTVKREGKLRMFWHCVVSRIPLFGPGVPVETAATHLGILSTLRANGDTDDNPRASREPCCCQRQQFPDFSTVFVTVSESVPHLAMFVAARAVVAVNLRLAPHDFSHFRFHWISPLFCPWHRGVIP